MKTFNTHKSNSKDLTKLHKDDLGMDIPKDYFKTSKMEILEKVSAVESKQPKVIKLRPILYAVAASIILIIGLNTILKHNVNPKNSLSTDQIEMLASANEEDVIINALFINDDDMGTFLESYVMNGLLAEAQLEQQDFNNIFINSIITKDSLLDSYINNNFIENIIL